MSIFLPPMVKCRYLQDWSAPKKSSFGFLMSGADAADRRVIAVPGQVRFHRLGQALARRAGRGVKFRILVRDPTKETRYAWIGPDCPDAFPENGELGV